MNPTQINWSYRLAKWALLLCLVEGALMVLVYGLSPSEYPQITKIQSQVQVQSEARKIQKEFVERFPTIPGWFAPDMAYLDWEYESLVTPRPNDKRSLEQRVDRYNEGIRKAMQDLHGSLYLLISVFFAGAVGALFILREKFQWLSSLVIVLSALLTTPPFTELLINLDHVFLFYWTVPLLLLGIGLFYLQIKRSKFLREAGTPVQTGRAYRVQQIIWGSALIAGGILLAVASYALSQAAGAKTFVVAAGPILYGLVLLFSAIYRLIKNK